MPTIQISQCPNKVKVRQVIDFDGVDEPLGFTEKPCQLKEGHHGLYVPEGFKGKLRYIQ